MLELGMCLNNQYTLIEKIGFGGGGVVYKAYHENLKKYVVVKQIKSSSKAILNSRSEADILKNLRNTYLPQVYDFLEIDGEIFTVIDYIDGKSLDKALGDNEKFDQKTVLKWALQAAEALAYLHSQNTPIIHSDIKPANIMLTERGDICLIDFNVSLAFDENSRTAIGVSVGYSPPEQYQSIEMYNALTGREKARNFRKTEMVGKSPENVDERRTEYILPFSGEESLEDSVDVSVLDHIIGQGVDTRSDIYSLGVTLYQLLTGIAPPGDFTKTIPLSKCKSAASEGLIKIIEKMMELSPDKRYRNGEELLNALKNIKNLDSIYRRYRRGRLAAGIGLVVMYAASAAMITFGVNLRNREKLNLYNQTVEAAEERIDEADFVGAQALIEAAMQQLPTRIAAYEKEVLRLYREGNYEECIRFGRETVNSPQYYIENESDEKSLGNILYVMGNAYYEMGDYANAVSCLESAIFYIPDNNAIYADLGVFYVKDGKHQKAESLLKQSEELGISQSAVYMIRGELALGQGETEKAVELFQSALKQVDSENELLRCVLLCAKAYDQMGEVYIDQEIELLEQWKGILGYRGKTQIGEKLGEVYARNKEFDKALQEFKELKEQGVLSYQLQENLAILYQQTDQLQLALDTLQEMAEQYPSRYETFKRLAYLEADWQQTKENDQRDYTQMESYYKQALKLYEEQGIQDMEMLQLERMMQELTDGKWFDE